MKIVVVSPNAGAVAYHRLISPHIKLKQMFPKVKIFNVSDPAQILIPEFKDAKVIIFSRVIMFDYFNVGGQRKPMEWVLELLKKRGAKIVVDVDDWWILDKHHILYNQLGENYINQVIRSLRVASMVFTTNKRLLKKIRPYNKHVHILPNAINLKEEQWQSKKKKKKVTFGYIGGSTHQQDLEQMQTTFKDVESFSCLQQYDWCFSRTEKMKDEFSYGTLYDEMTVSLAPLLHTPFNACKSNLKVIEAAAKGVCIAVSNVPPYTDWLPESIITFDNNESWESLKDISLDEAIKRGNRLKEELLSNDDYNLEKITTFRFQLYS